MRSKNSFINILISCISYVILMLSAFVTRSVFNGRLGINMVGVDSLLSNAVSMLAIAELGIGTGIVYKLYQPIIDHDTRKIAILLRFYKNAYKLISIIILSLGFCTTFIIPHSFKLEDLNYLYDQGFNNFLIYAIYLFYVFDVLASYLNAHKRAMITADQKNYIANIWHTVFLCLAYFAQIFILNLGAYFSNITILFAYIFVRIISRIFESLMIGRYFNKHYKDIDLKIKEKLPKTESKEMLANVKALFMHKIAGFSLRAGTTFIISKLVGSAINGMFSNYSMITSAINGIADQFFAGITASYGDLLNSTSIENSYKKFNVIYFMNYLLFSFVSISFYICITPLVQLWVGYDRVFGSFTTLLIVIYLYLYGMRESIFMVRTSSGLYKQDRWFAVLEAVVNALLGIWLILKFTHNIDGALLANIISCVLIPFWTQPIIVYHYLFKRSFWHYYARYAVYLAVCITAGLATYFVASRIHFESTLLQLIADIVCCLFIPNLINLLVFWKTPEMKYLFSTTATFYKNFRNRLKNAD